MSQGKLAQSQGVRECEERMEKEMAAALEQLQGEKEAALTFDMKEGLELVEAEAEDAKLAELQAQPKSRTTEGLERDSVGDGKQKVEELQAALKSPTTGGLELRQLVIRCERFDPSRTV